MHLGELPHLAENSAVLNWTVHLAREEPLKTGLALGLVAAIAYIGFVLVGPFPALAASVITVLSLCEFLFPVSYEVGPDGARVRTLLRNSKVSWGDVCTCYLDDTGIKLSPFDRQSRLEAFRGLYLRFGENREEVIQAVRMLRSEPCS